MVHVTDQVLGKNVRKSFSKTRTTLEIPNLIEIQTNSFKWLLEEGLAEVLRDVSPIVDYSGNLSIEFVSYSIDSKPKYPVEECKERDVNYAAPLKVNVRLNNKQTGEVKQTDIYMGDFPIMTENGTFVINGAERVIVSQIIRSPGMYYASDIDKAGKKTFTAQVIPYRGAWLEYEVDSNNVIYVRIDKNRKLPLTMFIRALGLSVDPETGNMVSTIETDEDIFNMFGDDIRLRATLEKDESEASSIARRSSAAVESLREIFRKLRPGEPIQVDAALTLINNFFFDPKRYDIADVGRYKFDKKMAISDRIVNRRLAAPAVSPVSGEVLFEEGHVITPEDAIAIENAAVNEVLISLDNGDVVKVFSNHTCWPKQIIGDDLKDCGVREKVSTPVLLSIMEECGGDLEAIKAACRARLSELCPKHITREDIYATINYLLGLAHDIGTTDDIDHLGNRRIRSVGEQLQNQMRIGFSRMEKIIRERMTTQDNEKLTPQALINIRPVATVIREFFGSSQLSQFMDQANPLSELTHKRRLSALGPGGLSRDRASFDVRDVHYTHYGRMCPIETPEGPNIGLISYLATYARISEYGFIEAPYRRVDRATRRVTDEVVYMTADVEDNYIIAQANEPLDENGYFINSTVTARDKNEFREVSVDEIDFMDVSPKMVVSAATAMIPFLENDDNSRALMGSNMQKQAVPLMVTDSPIVGTGMEYKVARDSGVVVVAKNAGVVEHVETAKIVIRTDDGRKDTYDLIKFKRTNQGTCCNQRPIVKYGERVEAGQIIADGPATSNGEIALGKNALIGFMTWEGYNYEDAVLLNENLVRNDVYTSLHIEVYTHEARDTKLGSEEITREIQNVGEDALRNLDAFGIVKKGTEVHAGDILVGKITPKGETDLTAEERLLRAIFGEKTRETRDTSLRLPHGESGIVVDVRVFSHEQGDELPTGVNKVVHVYIAQKRKISVGDKMAGRHGNKGVVSRILPPEDMPFLPDGTPLDIVLNPLGVPSRMNIGQVLEVHLGIAARKLGWKIMTPVFDGANEKDILECMKMANMWREVFPGENVDGKETREIVDPVTGETKHQVIDGKTVLYDGRTGEPFDNPVTVGIMYYLKLHHLVDDKIHARSNGPYSLVTQQPLGGKAQFGGQRFGEMEVWALEAYGAAYTLQEILTVKSDDVVGRRKAYEAIIQGQNIPTAGVPEAFKVLVKELQSLCLDIRVLNEKGEEIKISSVVDEEMPQRMNRHDSEAIDDAIGQTGGEDEYARRGFLFADEDGEFDLGEDEEDDEFAEDYEYEAESDDDYDSDEYDN
ncbi:MAG: DNA-directed RNA polymerase subunit beta [Eubacteriales bacterium]